MQKTIFEWCLKDVKNDHVHFRKFFQICELLATCYYTVATFQVGCNNTKIYIDAANQWTIGTSNLWSMIDSTNINTWILIHLG